MLGILKLGLITKLVLLSGILLGAGYFGYRVVRVEEPISSEAAAVADSTEADESGFFGSVHARINSVSVFVRILIFLFVALALPLITIPLVKKILARQSNACNLVMLAAYVVFDTLLAWLLAGVLLVDFWAFFFVIVAFAGSAAYSYFLLNRIEELQ